MPRLVGYHACMNSGGPAYALAHAPFISRFKYGQKITEPFLGEGRYLWYGDLEHGKWWGHFRYGNYCYVLEVIVECEDNDFLDLTSFEVRVLFRELLRRLKAFRADADGLPMGRLLEAMRYVNRRHPQAQLFPYRIVRAEEVRRFGSGHIPFRKYKSPAYFEPDPRWIMCVYPEYPLALLQRRIVHPSPIN